MKKSLKVFILVLACFALIGIVRLFRIDTSIMAINNQKLENSIQSIDRETVALNDVVPFEWDLLYTVAPYQSKTEIEKLVGFKSDDIKENYINEGMVHLLFVKDDKVVASILGYSSNLGYSIHFMSKGKQKVAFLENAQFNVTQVDDITILTYTE